MTVSTHMLAGITVGAVVAGLVTGEPKLQLVIIGTAILGSVLPDIDHENSYISNRFKVIGWLVSKLAGHRGFTHTLVFLIGTAVLLGLFEKMAGIGLAAGIGSHLFLDMLSGGVPLFMPVYNQRIWLAKIKTGGVSEFIFRICWFGFFIIQIYIRR